MAKCTLLKGTGPLASSAVASFNVATAAPPPSPRPPRASAAAASAPAANAKTPAGAQARDQGDLTTRAGLSSSSAFRSCLASAISMAAQGTHTQARQCVAIQDRGLVSKTKYA